MGRTGRVLAAALLGVACATGSASAQVCVDVSGEGFGPSREAAMRQAYENFLKNVGETAYRQWMAGSQRVGEVPGYTVRKLTTNCAARGAGQQCRFAGTVCAN